ncbi:MAG: glycerate kinase [Solirubrobacterales bacterium]
MTAAARRPVLVAPDKFKGTLPAGEVAVAIGRGLMSAGLEPVELQPIADGGEGSMDMLVHARDGDTLPAQVTDPLGRPVTAAFGLLDGGKSAIVEVAQASGLWRLAPEERDALAASTRGTGELIAAAIDAGARVLIVAAGGSATTDGGRGALEALGARFTEAKADLRALRKRLRGVKIVVACDVRNPMCGPDGAARVFAPQKGAQPQEVELLEEGLREWAALARRSTKRDPSDEPLAGAGGGIAGGLWAFADARLEPGAALLLDEADFNSRMLGSYAVVTGEGRLDRQTLDGKAVFEVGTRCRQSGVPCYAVVGHDDLGAFDHRLMNIDVEPAALPLQESNADDVEHAARRLGKRMS